jgi:hypothetical protein
LTGFYSNLGFKVHPAGMGMRIPKNLGLGHFVLHSVPSDQWFEQALQPSGVKPAN